MNDSLAHHVYQAVYNVMWKEDSDGVVVDYSAAFKRPLAKAARRCGALACTTRTLMRECLMWISSGVENDATELTLRLVAFAALGFTAGVEALLSRHPLLSPSAAGKALFYAAMHDRWSVVNLLLEKCGGETLSGFKQLVLVEDLTSWHERIVLTPNGFYGMKRVPCTDILQYAAHAGQRALCARLLEAGVQSCGLIGAAGAGHLDICRMILSAWEQGDEDARTAALAAAAEDGHLLVCELLLQHGADVCGEGHSQKRHAPLGLAAFGGHHAVCELLLEHGAAVHDRCDDEMPLTHAAGQGHLDICELLLRHGAAADADDGAALMDAEANEHTLVCQLLMRHGACIQ